MPMTNDLSLEELMKEGTYPEEYAEGKNWKILHGDTLKLVKAFQPGIFDAVITDPPYASGGTKQNERNRTTNQKYSSMSAANALPDFDGDNKDQRSWTHWMAEWLYDVRKACKKGAPICLFIDWRQYPSITDPLIEKSEFILSVFEQLVGAGNLSAKEKSILDRCAADVYRDYIRSGYTGEVPTLKDMYRQLMLHV